jgi:hypothetical protein
MEVTVVLSLDGPRGGTTVASSLLVAHAAMNGR